MKVDLPTFNGQMDEEKFLDWIKNVEFFFYYANTPEHKKVRLVALKLQGGASAWRDQLQNNRRLFDAFSLASKIEGSEEIKKTKTFQRKNSWDKQQRTNPTNSFRNFQQGSSSTPSQPVKKDDIPPKNPATKPSENISKKKVDNVYNRPTLGKCFRCSQQGHLSNECHQRRALTIEEGQEDDDSDDNSHEVSTPDEGDQLSCVVQRILFTPTADRIPQRNSLFRTRCTINRQHYKDQIICDVLDMDACHILLGRPWQYGTNYVHRGRANTIEFDWMSRCVVLYLLAAFPKQNLP
ncbi:uncharacterized protein E6C27_scaffold270G00430 [Cucumis melo var. makuwa]|uniref:CCHC-type domain-containing protein n=1 Tax=Cucumis melo var. makuwa TaxID=1194695 RepID=A0A5A7T7L8_CUCMM|nr:uncharacterized protein E6C27_scaffold270G00430 [Cucumis melo var. makuwa]